MNQSATVSLLDMYNFIFIAFMYKYNGVNSKQYALKRCRHETRTSNYQNCYQNNIKGDISLISLKCFLQSSEEQNLWGMIRQLISPLKSY